MKKNMSEFESIIFEGRTQKYIEKYIYRYSSQNRIKAIDRLINFLQSLRDNEEKILKKSN